MSSSNQGLIFDPGLCRCCGSLKKCRLLNSDYYHFGEKEVYSDMLLDCFSLMLSHLDGPSSERLVCAACVVRLRDACEFKKQVLNCEEAFLQMKLFYEQDDDIPKSTEIQSTEFEMKTEPVDTITVDKDLHDISRSYEVCNDMDTSIDAPSPMKLDLPIKDGDDSSGSNDDTPLKELIKVKSSKTIKNYDVKLKTKLKSKKGKKVIANDSGETLSMETLQQQNREKDKSFVVENNTLTIIEYSFVCPFKCRHNNLLCYYCRDQCETPETLRTHVSEHTPKKFKIMEHKKMIKVDITRIDCRLCDEKIETLDKFKLHITNVHGKKYYTKFNDLILPFRLTQNEMKCALCVEVYPYFHALNKHMNVHFSNYVCDLCGLGFVDSYRFVMHKQRHEVGDFPCQVCGKMFRAQYNRDLHVDRVHNKKARVYCPKCDVRLMTYAQKMKHLVEVHGDTPLKFPCDLCDKVYKTRRMITIHKRKEHFNDFRYDCKYCGQKFFTRFALTNHTPTHTRERNFRCDVCEKTYPRLKTLNDHMRIHNNDRRYRCHICGQAFIQNCSLKGHMKSQHPEYGGH